MSATEAAKNLAIEAALAASDKLATEIIAIDVSEAIAITEVFLMATGANEPQVKAIVDAVEERLRKIGEKPLRREGEQQARWVLLDYGDIVVHVQVAEERIHYAIERLWKDCPLIELPAEVHLPREVQGVPE
ncbi:MAG: ribosome silencing factor [Actinomycetes bacterium]